VRNDREPRPSRGRDIGMKQRRGIAALVVCLLTWTITVAAPPPTAGADAPDTEFYLPLVNAGSGKCFAPIPQDGHFDRVLPIQQQTCVPLIYNSESPAWDPEAYQLVKVDVYEEEDSPWYCLGCIDTWDKNTGYFVRNLKSQRCLDVREGARTDGSIVQQSTCDHSLTVGEIWGEASARRMIWEVVDGDYPNAFKLKNFNSGLCLDVAAGSDADYAQLQQYHCTSDNPAQNFRQDFTPNPTVVELTGVWTDGTSHRTAISLRAGTLTIDMSEFHRPDAYGTVEFGRDIDATFPDDSTHAGRIHEPNIIGWDNHSQWTKVVNTVLDINGIWTDGSHRRAFISDGLKGLTVDMSSFFNRPDAHGLIVNGSTISVTFPDELTHIGTLQPPDRINWSNGSVWTKRR